jgi:hypothetical protein
MAKFRAVLTSDSIIMSKGNKDNFKNSYEFKLKGMAYSGKIREQQTIGEPFTIDSSNPFISKNEKIGEVSFNQDKTSKLKGLSDSKKNRGSGGQGSQKSKGGKQTHTAGGDFRGKIQPTQVEDKKLNYKNIETKQAVDRVKRQSIPEKDVQDAFNKWANIDPKTKNYIEGQAIPRDQDQIAEAYNNYQKSKTAATRFNRWKDNQEYDRILERNEDAVTALSSLPSAIRNTKTVGAGSWWGKGYTGDINKSFKEATQKQGLGASDKRFKKAGWFWNETRQSNLEKAALEAEEEYAKADVSEAKAIGEEGKERAVRSEIKRKSEIAAEKKARAGFWRRMGVPIGRKSLAVERVEVERTELDTAKKVAQQEGKAAVEAVRTQRRAGKFQEGAIGARQRAQRLEAKELQRIETKLDEGAPLSKADQSKLKFIRDYSEATPSGFVRGEKQFKSIVAPSEAEIAAAREWARQQSRQQGKKK